MTKQTGMTLTVSQVNATVRTISGSIATLLTVVVEQHKMPEFITLKKH